MALKTTLLYLLLLLLQPGLRAATVTLQGGQTNQVIDGFGVNVNYRSWNGAELQPVFDAFIDQAGMTQFRVVYELSNWETNNDNADPNVLDWNSYSAAYGSPEFTRLWDMFGYLNSRGITNGAFFNFMGWGPSWMMDSDGRTLKAGMEGEWAEMIASALVYARNNRGLQFSLVAPNNEPDILNEGIKMDATPYVNSLHQLALKLDANGLNDVRFIGPDRAGGGTAYMPEMLADPVVMGKVRHFGVHSYSSGGGGSGGVLSYIKGSAYPDRTFWMTEFNVWCTGCDTGSPGPTDWTYARGTAEYLLSHLLNGASACFPWEGYDSIYAHHGYLWSYWGLIGVDNINAPVKTYTARKNFYTVAQISKWVRPGAQRINISGTTSPFTPLLAFKHAGLGQVTIVGINTSSSAATLTGTLNSLPAVSSLNLYHTSASANLANGGSVAVNSGTFSATVPANCVFTLTGYSVLATVPGVVGQTQSAATAAITGAGLTLGTITQSSSATVPLGSVISQNPAEGTQVAPGSVVNLVVSSGPPPVTVPDVVGQTQSSASSTINSAGLAVGTVTQESSETVPQNSVITQNPSGGASVPAGSPVDLVISLGTQLATVPTVIGQTQQAATGSILGAGLTLGTITQSSSATVPLGSVISQTPAAGSQVTPGSHVNLVISTGPAPVTVPNVVGQTQATATSAISGAGLAVGNVTEFASMSVAAGSVISQEPVGGSQVVAGSTVNLVVSLGLPPVAMYSFSEGNGPTASDESGNGNLGIINQATWTTGGRDGNALSFDGSSSRVAINDSSSLALSTGMTLEAWVYPTTLSDWRPVIFKELPLGLAYALYAHGDTSYPAAYVNVGGGDVAAIGTAQLALNAWTHLAVTYDGATLKLYVDGTLVGSQPVSGTLVASSSALSIGGSALEGEYFAGRIDEVRIYNRALSAGEIQTDMNSPILVTVPDLVGQPQAAATVALTAIGLVVEEITESASMTVPLGSVISQNPVEGERVAPGSAINLVVSSGPVLVTVPDVEGQTQIDAASAVLGVGLAVGNVTLESSATVPQDSVIRQNPSGGTLLPAGSPIDMVVSSGPRLETVPNVVGQTQAAATTAITGVGFTLGSVSSGQSATVPSGSVISQTPAAGSLALHGSSVDLVISTGMPPVAVPNVVGQTRQIATNAILAAGLTTGNVTLLQSTSVPVGWVISQNPAGGTQLAFGSAVNLVVSSGSPPVAAYSFKEGSGSTVSDESGNGNLGTLNQTTWTASGRFDNALTFNGSSSWVTIANSSSLSLVTGMTLEAWVYPTTLSAWRTVILKERPSGLAYALYAHDNAPRPAAYVNVGGADNTALGSTQLSLNVWTHLATTYDGVTLRLYVNGSLVGSRNVSGVLVASTSSLRIGGNAIWGEYFAGRIDEVRIYNRALSAGEIQADMNAPIIVSVPTVLGQTQSAAATAITGAGLVLGTITGSSSATVPAGSVISQTPTGGISVPPGSAVDLVVSSGPLPVTVAGTVWYAPAEYPPILPTSKVVSGVTVNLTGDGSGSTMSGSEGLYSLAGIPYGGDYEVGAAKSDDSSVINGINSTDLVLIQRSLLGLTPLGSPYKLLAADVNGSGTINSTDLVLLQRLLLGYPNGIPAELWRFVPADYVFADSSNPWNAPTSLAYPNLVSDQNGADFVAIKLGDVNNSWSPPAGASSLGLAGAGMLLAAPGPAVGVGVGSGSVTSGQGVSVPITVSGFSNVTSVQFTLSWDPAVLRFGGVGSYGLRGMSVGSFGTVRSGEGKLTFVWYDPQGLGVTEAEGATLFTVSFEAVGKAGSVSALRLGDVPTVREASVNLAVAGMSSLDGEIRVVSPGEVRVSAPVYREGVFELTVPTVTGRSYVLEYTDRLPATNWMTLPAIKGDGTIMNLVDPAATNHQRFYRVRVE